MRLLNYEEIGIISLLFLVWSVPFWPLFIPLKISQSLSGSFFSFIFSIDSKITSLWIIQLLKILMGYGFIFLPMYTISVYLNKCRYFDREKLGTLPNLLSIFFCDAAKLPSTFKSVESNIHNAQTTSSRYFQILIDRWNKLTNPEEGTLRYYILMIFVGLGLQLFYLSWGILQEKIMTHKYGKEKFLDSQILVFLNRIFALLIAVSMLILLRFFNKNIQINNDYSKIDDANLIKESSYVPYFKYSYPSLSNILSSWFQYEALKFVSFPVQVMTKASKIVPVMLMGKLVRNKSYRFDEYVTAVLISFGLGLFMIGASQKTIKESHVTNKNNDIYSPSFQIISGILTLSGYILFDSFTSNYQDVLFKRYSINLFQMMAGVNSWSSLFTGISLLENKGFSYFIHFIQKHPDFLWDSIALSICGAVGQLFIFFTISKFGALTFTLIMTMRQALSVLLSCLIYGHYINSIGIFGLSSIFCAIFSRSYLNYKYKL